MDVKTFELSLEQQFQLRCLQNESENLNREQVIHYLLETMQQLMVKDNLIKDIMKKGKF